jgi:pyruvate/2-oxoglutarate dehydrogenase complex dihydrolipoamide acyltransferase (E2) component
MAVYYYVSVPQLPDGVRHQRNSVEVVKYLAVEGVSLVMGTPLVRVQNWWAVMELDAVGAGILSNAFFRPGTHVRVGHPLAIIDCDPEDAPQGEETAA